MEKNRKTLFFHQLIVAEGRLYFGVVGLCTVSVRRVI